MRLCSRICFGVLLCAFSGSADISGDSEKLNQTFFISEIFDKYGVNNFMTYEGFEHLLENLGLGKLKFEKKHDVSLHKINGTFHEVHDTLSLHKHNHIRNSTDSRQRRNLRTEGENSEKSLQRKCLTVQDILITYGLDPYHGVIISPSIYQQICPAIVYELDQKLCQVEETLEDPPKQEERHLVWVYASLSVLVMGVSGMLCVLIVPLIKNNYCSGLLQFLIALAVGTLCGDALIHLLPQVFSRSGTLGSEVIIISRGTITLVAIYVFFIIENLLKGIQIQKQDLEENKESSKMISISEFESHGHGHSHGMHGIKSVAWMAIMGDILHNVTDGLSIGAAFGSGLSSGFASSIAIFCHELPHELGDYAILLASGMSVKKSLFYNFVSSVFSFLGMVAGVLLGKIEDASLWINAFTAGSFLYIALSDLVPEMKAMQSKSGLKGFIIQAMGLSCGGILMFTIALYEDHIESLLS